MKKNNRPKRIIWNDAKNSLFSSKTTILKATGLLLITLIYGFFYIFAFWNPFVKFDQIPSAIYDHEPNKFWVFNIKKKKIELKDSFPIQNNRITNSLNDAQYFWGTAGGLFLGPLFNNKTDKTITIGNNSNSYNNSLKINLKYIQKKSSPKIENKYWMKIEIPENYQNNVVRLINNLLSFNGGIDPLWEKSFQNNVKVLEGQSVTNTGGCPDSSPYYTKYFGPRNGNYYDQTLSFKSSYLHNYVVGYFMQLFSFLFEGSIANFAPNAMATIAENEIRLSSKTITNNNLDKNKTWLSKKKYLNNYLNSPAFQFIKLISDLPIIKNDFPNFDNLVNSLKNADLLFTNGIELKSGDIGIDSKIFNNNFETNIINKNSLFNFKSLIPKYIQGLKYNNYGFGLGQLFICISIYMGFFVQTIVLSRKHYIKKISPTKKYFSKSFIMITIGIIQTLILFIALAIIGYSNLGINLLTLIAWIIFGDIVIGLIVQGIWFAIKDEIIAKWVILLVLVFSIVSSGGIYPPVMQNDFFQVINIINPFSYIINGSGYIIYGLAVSGTDPIYNNIFLKDILALLIFAVIFVSIGYFNYIFKLKFNKLGTLSNKKIRQALYFTGNKKLLKNKKIKFYLLNSQLTPKIKQWIIDNYSKNKKIIHFFRHSEHRD